MEIHIKQIMSHMNNIDYKKVKYEAQQIDDLHTLYDLPILRNERNKIIKLATELINLDNVNLKPDIKSYIDNNINLFPLYAKNREKYDEYCRNINKLNLTIKEQVTELYRYYIKYVLDYSKTVPDSKQRALYIKYINDNFKDNDKKQDLINIYNEYCLSLSNLYSDYTIVNYESSCIIVFKNDTYELTLFKTSGYGDTYTPNYHGTICVNKSGFKYGVLNGHCITNMAMDEIISDMMIFFEKYIVI